MSSPGPSCGRPFSPRQRWAQVGGQAVQADLRRAFAAWGLPGWIRVDNGVPWRFDEGLPPELACWLIGQGVGVIWNPPHRPQANGVVERSQGVGKAWAEPHTAADAAELQRRLDYFDRLQRERYQTDPGGLSRCERHPGLAHSGRPYDPSREAETWALSRLLEHLSEYVVQRKVDAQGKIRLYNNQRFLGREWAGQLVWASLDPLERRWVVADESGKEFRRLEASELTEEKVRGLRMTYRASTRPAAVTEAVLVERPDAVPPAVRAAEPSQGAAAAEPGVGNPGKG